jgi:hypothetical protein
MTYIFLIIGLIIFIYIAKIYVKYINGKYNIKLINLLKNKYLGFHYNFIYENLDDLFLLVVKIDDFDDRKFLITKSAHNRTMIIFQFKNLKCDGFFIQSWQPKFKFYESNELKKDVKYQLLKELLKESKIRYDVNNYLPKKYFYNNKDPKLNFKNSNSFLFTKYDLFYESEDNRYISFNFNEFSKYKHMNYLLGSTEEDINAINDYIIENNSKLLFYEK